MTMDTMATMDSMVMTTAKMFTTSVDQNGESNCIDALLFVTAATVHKMGTLRLLKKYLYIKISNYSDNDISKDDYIKTIDDS